MFWFPLILVRILFIACMVFILGFVFGNFSKRPGLARIAKAASILVIILFISVNIFAFRSARWHHGWCNGTQYYNTYRCDTPQHR